MSSNPFYQHGYGGSKSNAADEKNGQGVLQNGQLPMDDAPPPPYQNQMPPSQGQHTQQWGAPTVPAPAPPSSGYRPQIGFVKLPPRFGMWSKINGWSGSFTFEMRPSPTSPPLYLAKQTNSGVSFLDAANTSHRIGKANDKGMFSSKTVLEFGGYTGELSKYSESSPMSFSAPVGGRLEPFQWRHTSGSSMVLLPSDAPSQAPPIASWYASNGTVKDGKEVGVFEFHAPALSGELGDILVALAVMTVSKIVHTQWIMGVAAKGGAASGAAVAAAS